MRKPFQEVFDTDKTALIGMIHLSGKDMQEKIERALEEILIYEETGFDGTIIENYLGRDFNYVRETLKELRKRKNKLKIGVNILGYPSLSFDLADFFGDELVSFIQIDSIHPKDFPKESYQELREKHSNIPVFGGINFKYKTQETGKNLERELVNAMKRCEGIVTTGEGTGIETPIQMLQDFREIIEDFPLIVGAGVNIKNIYETSKIVDGIIIGSYLKLKDGEETADTRNPVIPKRCEEIKYGISR
jgi:uncharacterized protein